MGCAPTRFCARERLDYALQRGERTRRARKRIHRESAHQIRPRQLNKLSATSMMDLSQTQKQRGEAVRD